MKQILQKTKELCPLSWKGWVVFCFSMAAGAGLCLMLQKISTSDVHVPMIFVLIVLIISMLTEGYFYGILAAVVSVFAVNWAFTFPYNKLDFSIYGYPLTFLTMLAVGVAASTLATRLKETQKLKFEAEREKTRANLLRSVSHDLRTPLTAISGSISAILEDDGSLPEDGKKELLENAKADADWLYRMVENLLSITRISGSGTGEITKTDELLEEVLSEAVMNFKKRNPDIAVHISVPEEIMFVPMDAMLIEQVIVNLLDNAVTHGKTTDSISVTAENGEEHVAIYIRDNGEGIDPRLLARLFDGSLSFEGTRGPDSSRFMGIGLTVCRTIVEAHGGSISARNGTNGGAEFCFTLDKEEYSNEYSGQDSDC